MTNRCSTSPEFICQQVSREICDENSAQKDDFSTSCKPSKSCRMEIQSVPREVLMPKCIKSMKSICQNETKANCKAEPHLNDQNCTSNCRNESQEICRNVTNPICQPENSFGPCKPDSGKADHKMVNVTKCEEVIIGQDCQDVPIIFPRQVCHKIPQEACETVPSILCNKVFTIRTKYHFTFTFSNPSFSRLNRKFVKMQMKIMSLENNVREKFQKFVSLSQEKFVSKKKLRSARICQVKGLLKNANSKIGKFAMKTKHQVANHY